MINVVLVYLQLINLVLKIAKFRVAAKKDFEKRNEAYYICIDTVYNIITSMQPISDIMGTSNFHVQR